jgi:hypothetical protein
MLSEDGGMGERFWGIGVSKGLSSLQHKKTFFLQKTHALTKTTLIQTHITKSAETIRRWNAEYRVHNSFFRNGHRSRQSSLPPLLHDNPTETNALRQFIRKEIACISVDKVHAYVTDVLLPNIGGKLYSEKKTLLSHYRIKNFNHSTAWRWMRALGMRYSNRIKNYYIDGHEREDVVMSRNLFVQEYLKEEMRMHRWLQFPLQEAVQLGLDIETGYHYKAETSDKFVEFHVDAN